MPLEPPDLDVTHLRGRIAGLIRASVLATLTEAQKATLGGQVPETVRRFMAAAPDPESWVPTADLALFLAAARPLTPLRTERTRAQLEADLLLEGSPLLKGADPRQVVTLLPVVYADVHRGGSVTLVEVQDGEAEILVQARYPYASWYTEVLPAWLARALGRAGGDPVTVRHLPPGPDEMPWRHLYRMTWRA
jgi:hypothetical protein